jgi:hypothetical protein
MGQEGLLVLVDLEHAKPVRPLGIPVRDVQLAARLLPASRDEFPYGLSLSDTPVLRSRH